MSTVMRYRKKPIEIEAEQYIEYGKLVKGMCNSMSCYWTCNEPHVHTIHDNQIVVLAIGDYVIPEPDGEHYYPCKADIFQASYDLVRDGIAVPFATSMGIGKPIEETFQVPVLESVSFIVDRLRYTSTKWVLSGRQLKAFIDFDPVSHDLWIDEDGKSDLVKDSDTIDLSSTAKFFTARKIINAG